MFYVYNNIRLVDWYSDHFSSGTRAAKCFFLLPVLTEKKYFPINPKDNSSLPNCKDVFFYLFCLILYDEGILRSNI